MLKKTINITTLQEAVIQYYTRTLNSTYKGTLNGDNSVLIFDGKRRKKIVVVSVHQFPKVHLSVLLGWIADLVDSDPTFSDNIDFYTIRRLTSVKVEVLQEMAQKDFSLALTITDGAMLERNEEFRELLEDDTADLQLEDSEKTLYDYLSVSNASSDIKNGIYYSLLLLIIYRKGSISEEELKREMEQRFGRKLGDIGKDLETLRKAGKLKQGKIELTDDELDKVRKAEHETKAIEEEFMSQYANLTEVYDIAEKEPILEALKQIYIVNSKYNLQSEEGNHSGSSDDLEKAHHQLRKLVSSSISNKEKTDEVVSRLLKLCTETTYMQRIGLNTAFLNLYRSSRYEDYVKGQNFLTMLDTSVVIYLLCAKSGMQTQEEWNDADYKTICDLIGYKESQDGSIHFLIPYDYLIETFYEYKKALQVAWFDKFPDLPIPPETTNIFYNYYLFVKNQKSVYEDKQNYTFSEFAHDMGFPITNIDEPRLKRQSLMFLKRCVEVYQCEYIEEIRESYENFDVVRNQYAASLEDKGRDKSLYAINSDVRQAFYLTTEKKKNKDTTNEYYFCTWDKTLSPLRTAVADQMQIFRTYSIQSPLGLLNKLSFKLFHLGKGSISDTVFAYAEHEYNTITKIQSLYDNVLIPYFASVQKGNARLVISILNMEKSQWDKEAVDDENTNRKTALEDIFFDVLNKLPKYQLTSQNLRDLLANKDLSDQIQDLFQQAFDAKKTNNDFDLANPLCEMMKQQIVESDEE